MWRCDEREEACQDECMYTQGKAKEIDFWNIMRQSMGRMRMIQFHRDQTNPTRQSNNEETTHQWASSQCKDSNNAHLQHDDRLLTAEVGWGGPTKRQSRKETWRARTTPCTTWHDRHERKRSQRENWKRVWREGRWDREENRKWNGMLQPFKQTDILRGCVQTSCRNYDASTWP